MWQLRTPCSSSGQKLGRIALCDVDSGVTLHHYHCTLLEKSITSYPASGEGQTPSASEWRVKDFRDHF